MRARTKAFGLIALLLAGGLLAPETASANPIDWAGSEIGGVISGSPGTAFARSRSGPQTARRGS